MVDRFYMTHRDRIAVAAALLLMAMVAAWWWSYYVAPRDAVYRCVVELGFDNTTDESSRRIYEHCVEQVFEVRR